MSKVDGMQSGTSAGIALESCQWFVPVRTCRTGLSTYRTGLNCMYCGAKVKWRIWQYKWQRDHLYYQVLLQGKLLV